MRFLYHYKGVDSNLKLASSFSFFIIIILLYFFEGTRSFTNGDNERIKFRNTYSESLGNIPFWNVYICIGMCAYSIITVYGLLWQLSYIMSVMFLDTCKWSSAYVGFNTASYRPLGTWYHLWHLQTEPSTKRK